MIRRGGCILPHSDMGVIGDAGRKSRRWAISEIFVWDTMSESVKGKLGTNSDINL